MSILVSGFPSSVDNLTSAVPGIFFVASAKIFAPFSTSALFDPETINWIGVWLAVPNIPIGFTRTLIPGTVLTNFLISSPIVLVDFFLSSFGTNVTSISDELFEVCPTSPSFDAPTVINAFFTSGRV